MIPKSNDRLDQELAAWFVQRGRAWSGTAAELLNSVRTGSDLSLNCWPESSRGLYDHLKNHEKMLQQLGVDVTLRDGFPRIVSLRPRPAESSLASPLVQVSPVDTRSDPPPNLSLPVADQAVAPVAQSASPDQAAHAVAQNEPLTAKSDLPGRYANARYVVENTSKERVFEDTAEALVAIGEIRQQIRALHLDLESAVNLVNNAALEMTRCYRIAVGFFPETKGRTHRTGWRSSIKGQSFDANIFRSSLVAGEAVQLEDAQSHQILGSKFRREGVGSMIIVPIFRGREVAGAMEFLFLEKRKFSPGDVMDLGLIAGVISEGFDNVTGDPALDSKNHELPSGPPPGKSSGAAGTVDEEQGGYR